MGLTVVPHLGNVSRLGQRDAAVDADGPGLSRVTQVLGGAGGGLAQPGENPPASCPLQGYSGPGVTQGPRVTQTSAPPLFGSFFLFLGILLHPRSLFSLRLARTPCCPQPHSRTPIERLTPFPSCRPLPSAAAGVRLTLSSGQAHVDSDVGSVSLALAIHSTVILGLPPPTWEGRTPPQGTPPLPGHSLPL